MTRDSLGTLRKLLVDKQNKFSHLRQQYDLMLAKCDDREKDINESIIKCQESLDALENVRLNLTVELSKLQKQQQEITVTREDDTVTFYKQHNLPDQFFTRQKKITKDTRDTRRDSLLNRGDRLGFKPKMESSP